jgi:hypothetical protein
MRLTVLVFALLSITITANAQIVIPSPVPVPIPSPIVSAYSNSVIDHDGNVLIFDVSYIYSTPAADQPRFLNIPTMKTHVTVIGSGGESKKGFDFDGSFQVVGAGRRAVYAIVNTYSLGAPIPLPLPMPPSTIASSGTGTSVAVAVVTPLPISVTRQLVALNVIAGTLPSSLPSITPLPAAEVKVAAGANETDPDRVALIESPFFPVPLAPTATTVSTSVSHTVRLFTFDGGSFTELTKERIAVP